MGWGNTGNGFGTHDWVMCKANAIAVSRGVTWVDQTIAIKASDDPDTVLGDSVYHIYDVWGASQEGDSPSKIAECYANAVASLNAGDEIAASYYVGLLSHYYSDTCNPLHTDNYLTENHYAYEEDVNGTTTDVDSLPGWVVDDGHSHVADPEAATVNAATTAHGSYTDLVTNYVSYGINNTTVQSITQGSLNRAANGLADMIVSIQEDAEAGWYDPDATAVRIEDSAVGVTFDRWVPSASTLYSGGTYTYGYWTNTEMNVRFTGTNISWIGPKQPGYGMADVYIDGSFVTTVDCYAPSGTLSTTIWQSSTLAAGSHTLTIKLVGEKNAASSGYVVVVDNFSVTGSGAALSGSRLNETVGALTGTWVSDSNATYTSGTYLYSRWSTASIRYDFYGTKVAWIGPRSTTYGKADVYIDGTKVATVSQYSATTGWRYRVWESATLARGSHTLAIVPLGTKESASTGTNVVVDGFDTAR